MRPGGETSKVFSFPIQGSKGLPGARGLPGTPGSKVRFLSEEFMCKFLSL